jgi:putative ABC transport system permease protein
VSFYAFSGAIEQGLVYGIMALGVYITFRVLDFPDLTVDGSLPLGAAVCSVCIVSGWPPFLALLPAMGAGFLAGMVTGLLTTKLRILHLLASILTMTALYSVNIRVMGGRPNIALIGRPTVFGALDWLRLPYYLNSNLVFLAGAIIIIGGLIWLMHTEFGQALLATGDNPRMITSLGVNTHFTIVIGVGLSNSLVALSGALVAQNQGAADVSMGVGTIVAGLASIVVGETLLGSRKIQVRVLAVLLGSIVYRVAIALALSMKFKSFSFTPSDLNLITATLVVLALVMPRLKAAWAESRRGLGHA